MFDLSQRFNKRQLADFAVILEEMQRKIGFKVSARGWCYLMETARYINKDQFDKVESLINKCRRLGFLDVDFVAEEDARAFSGVESRTGGTIREVLKENLRYVRDGYFFTPDWWLGEEYYIQMLVEKIDLRTLFQPVCRTFHIPIANAKGWSSILQRAEYARRFKEAEEKGLKCVLLYCGDHDPDGLRISTAIRQNLEQIADIRWSDGTEGYDPANLEIQRFGLNYDFIVSNDYTWIDNLITGSKKNLADPRHPNYKLAYLQQYLRTIGERKCEANAVVTTPRAARDLCRDAIQGYLGADAEERFDAKVATVRERYDDLLDRYDIMEPLDTILELDDIDSEEDVDI